MNCLPHDLILQLMADLNVRALNGSFRQLQHGVSAQADRQAKRLQARTGLGDSEFFIEKDRVYGDLHFEGVDGFAGNYP